MAGARLVLGLAFSQNSTSGHDKGGALASRRSRHFILRLCLEIAGVMSLMQLA